jgi:hypothetical protein
MPAPQVPLIGQQHAQIQAVAHQIMMKCYLDLIPVVASRQIDACDSFNDRDALPERIADEAWKIAAAAVKRVGIDVGK